MESTTAAATAALEPAQELSRPQPRWGFGTRIGFRFAFAYFVLYMLPFPSEWLHLPWRQSGPNLSERWYDAAGQKIVPWVAKHILHLSKDITIFSNGSGDTTYNWVAVLCFVILAAMVTVVWSIADRKRTNYEKLHAWFRVVLRLWLAGIIGLYGMFKLYQAQFPAPYLARYLERYGDSSPMGILWTLMGASRAYTFFTGTVETLGAVLLIIPRLATLGALVSAAAMTNVFVMNMTYDVPVKLFSFHLLLASIFVAAPDLEPLWDFFVHGRNAQLCPDAPELRRKRSRQALRIAQFAAGAYMLLFLAIGAHQQAQSIAGMPQKTPNYGIWQVDEFWLDGKLRPPLLTDNDRWQDLVIQSPGGAIIVPMNGTLDRSQAKVGEAKNTLEVTSSQPKWSARLTYARRGDTLTLEGSEDGRPLKVTLHRVDPPFLLKTRGFHWVNEFPFNR
ncbi:MAG TPA: hypothetical protein VKB56_11375 [Terriglobales bacterium]|nr:hypothetical protein [Terriglobales bacterium]